MAKPDTDVYHASLASTVMQPSAENMRELLSTANLVGIGAHEASRDYQELLAAQSNPTDEHLAAVAQAENEAGEALVAARDKFAEAQAALDQAEAQAIEAKQRHREARSDRMAADRAMKRPAVKAALENLSPQ